MKCPLLGAKFTPRLDGRTPPIAGREASGRTRYTDHPGALAALSRLGRGEAERVQEGRVGHAALRAVLRPEAEEHGAPLPERDRGERGPSLQLIPARRRARVRSTPTSPRLLRFGALSPLADGRVLLAYGSTSRRLHRSRRRGGRGGEPAGHPPARSRPPSLVTVSSVCFLPFRHKHSNLGGGVCRAAVLDTGASATTPGESGGPKSQRGNR